MAYPTNIRNKMMFGYNIDTQEWSRPDVGGKTWFADAWDTHHADRWDNQPEHYSLHYAVVMFVFEWKQLYVEESITPTGAQARDHTWSNYIWNQGGIHDPIDHVRSHARIAAGDAVIIPGLALSATATPQPLPQFIKNNSGWWWQESTTGKDKQFLRFDVAAARQHAEDVFYAMCQKYGDDDAVGMIFFREYFNGPSADHPAGLDKTAHKEAIKTIISNTIPTMPTDSEGKRMMIGLASPNYAGSFVRDDIIDLGIVPFESNVELQHPPSGFPLTNDMLYWSNAGIPVAAKGDSKFYDDGKTYDWSSAPTNPNGHTGSAIPLDVEDTFWYKINVIPTHIMLFNTGPGLTQAAINTAISKFGRGGTEVATWGAGPPEFVGASVPGGGGGTNPTPQLSVLDNVSANASTITLDQDGNTEAGDRLLVVINTGANRMVTPAAEAGTALIDRAGDSSGSHSHLLVYSWQATSADEPSSKSYTFTLSASHRHNAILVRLKDVDGSPIIASDDSGGANVATDDTPTLTTLENNSVVISLAGIGTDNLYPWQNQPAGSVNQATDWFFTTGNGMNHGLAMAQEVQAVAGASTAKTFEANDSARYVTAQLAFAPAPGANTLVASEAGHAHDADNVALNTGAAVSVVANDSGHAHMADKVALSVGGVLLQVASANHAQGTDNVLLNENRVEVGGSYHGHAADNAALTTEKDVVVIELYNSDREPVILKVTGGYEEISIVQNDEEVVIYNHGDNTRDS